jgi:hypothetical protein
MREVKAQMGLLPALKYLDGLSIRLPVMVLLGNIGLPKEILSG